MPGPEILERLLIFLYPGEGRFHAAPKLVGEVAAIMTFFPDALSKGLHILQNPAGAGKNGVGQSGFPMPDGRFFQPQKTDFKGVETLVGFFQPLLSPFVGLVGKLIGGLCGLLLYLTVQCFCIGAQLPLPVVDDILLRV